MDDDIKLAHQSLMCLRLEVVPEIMNYVDAKIKPLLQELQTIRDAAKCQLQWAAERHKRLTE